MYGELTTVASTSSGGMSAEIATTSGRGTITAIDLLRREVEDLVEHLLLGLVQLAHVLGRGDAVADVLARVGDHPGRSGLHPKHAQHDVGRLLQHPHERMREPGEPVERNRERDREPLRLLQRDRLRDELAEDDGEVGQDRERDQERDRVRERRIHQAREERLADGTEQDGRDRDPDLNGRDEAHRVVHQPERRTRAAAAAQRPLLEPAPPRGDERVLRRHEDRVPQHEEEDDHDAERCSCSRQPADRSRQVRNAPEGAQVLGGWSSTIDQAAV